MGSKRNIRKRKKEVAVAAAAAAGLPPFPSLKRNRAAVEAALASASASQSTSQSVAVAAETAAAAAASPGEGARNMSMPGTSSGGGGGGGNGTGGLSGSSHVNKRNRVEMESSAAAPSVSAPAPAPDFSAFTRYPPISNNGNINGNSNSNSNHGSSNSGSNSKNNNTGPLVAAPPPAPPPLGAMNRNMPRTNANGGDGHNAGQNSSHMNASPSGDSVFARNYPSGNGNGNGGGGSFHYSNKNNTCTRQEEIEFHGFLKQIQHPKQNTRKEQKCPPSLEHIYGRTHQWPAILHPGSVVLVLVALLPPDPSLALLQDCLIRHCRTVGIPWLELNEHAYGQSKGDRDRHRFLWDCITDRGSAACLYFRRGKLDLKYLEPRPKPLAEPMSDRALDNLYSNMGWTRALCNAPERKQVYKLVLDCIAERQGYLPMEQELQIVLQQVEARTTRLVLVSSQVWQQKLKETLLLLQQCWDKQVPIFLVYDYHFCNNQRFPPVFSLRNMRSAREKQLQDLQELCRTMVARPLLVASASVTTSALEGMKLGSVDGPSSPTGSPVKAVARPIEGVATAPSTNYISIRQNSVTPVLPFPQSSQEVSGPASSLPSLAINSSSGQQEELPNPVTFTQQSSPEKIGRISSLANITNSLSGRQGDVVAANISSTPSSRHVMDIDSLPPMAAAGDRETTACTPPVVVLPGDVSTKSGPEPKALTEPLPQQGPEMTSSRASSSESQPDLSPPEDLILTPGELSVQEEARIYKLLSGHFDRDLPCEHHWVTPTKFKTAGWTRLIIHERVALVLLGRPTKQDPRKDISNCVADYCRKVGIPCLRLCQRNKIGKDFLETNIGISFHPCFLDLKSVLDPGRRPDLLAASIAARPLSPLITNKSWAYAVCGTGHREHLEKFIALRQDFISYELTNNVAGEIAHVSKLVDQKKSRLVLISASAWIQRFEETLSLIEMCKRHQVPVFLVHDKQFCYPPQFRAIFCLKNKTYAGTLDRELQELEQRSRKLLGTAKLDVTSSRAGGRTATAKIDLSRGSLSPAEKATSPMEIFVEVPSNDGSTRKEVKKGPPTRPSAQDTLVASARVESIQSTVTRKRQRDDQGSPDSNESENAGTLPITRSEDPSQQQRMQTDGEEAPPSGHICTVREETNIYELLRKHLARADDSQRQQSLVRIGLNTEMWPQLLHPDRVGLVVVARLKPPSLKCLSDCVVEYCRRVAIPCLVLREAMDGDSNISLQKLVTEDEMTCLGIRRGLFDLKDVVELEKRPWILASQIRSKTIPKHTSGMAWTKLLCNERQQDQVFSLMCEFVSDQTQDCFPCVKEQITHLLGMFDKMSNKQARNVMVLITAEAWLHHLPETNVLIQKCKRLCTPLFLIYDYPPFLAKREYSCIIVSSILTEKKIYVQDLFCLSLFEMAARPDHPSVTEARSVTVSYWKDGLCDANESEAVLQLLRKCQFPVSSGENPFFDISPELAASTSLILCGARSVRLCVLQKRAILVFVALDSRGAFQTEAVFALVELCRELGTPFLFVQEEVCVKEVLYADKKQPIVFCLTSVLTEDEDILRSLQDLAAIKRKKVLGEFFQSVNVESCVNTAVSESTNSSQHGVDLVENDDDNAMVEDATKVSSVETFPHQDTAEITIADVSRRQIPLIQSVTYASVPTAKELFFLEEAVSLLEDSLETIRARKDKVEANLLQEQDKRVHQVESVANLQSRSKQLHTAQTRQFELEQELTRSIARSRAQLGRLTGHGSVLSTEDISGLSVVEGDARASGGTTGSSTTKDIEVTVPDQPAREERETNLSLLENSTRLPNKHVDSDDAKKDTEFKSSTIYEIPDHDRFSLFWASRGIQDRTLTPFLPIVNSRELLKSVMNVSVRDILSLDGHDSSGRHRREVLWNTSLDVRPMASLSTEMEGNLGQSESYQAQHNHLEDTFEAGAAFEQDEKICGEIESGRSEIDPNVPLCPYELAGLCLDPYCAYQHLSNRPLGNVLPRELLPLPPLSLTASARISTPMAIEEERAIANDEPLNKKRRWDAKRAITAVCEDPVTADASLVPPGRDDIMSSNADFVFVGEISEREEGTSDGEEKAELAFAGKNVASMWWLSEKEKTSLHLTPSALSFSAFLESLGYRFSKSLTEVRLSTEVPRTEEAACSMVGMTVDCTGLAIHAGRYDISVAFKSPVGQLMDSLKDSTFKRIIRKGMDIVRNEENRAFSFAAVTQHPFLVAFETQLAVALVSVFLKQFRFFLRGKSDSDSVNFDSCCAWHAPLNAFESAFSSSKKDLDHFRSSLIDIRSNFLRPEYSEVKSEEWESEASLAHRSVVHWLLEDVCRGASLQKVASEASSIRCLIDDILEPTWLAAKEVIRANPVSEDKPTFIYLRAVLTIGYVVLGAVEKAASLIPCDQLIPNVKTELEELYSTIDKILLALRRMVRQLPWMDLLLSPLFAANISLACTIQLYEKSQHRLESLLCGDVGSTNIHPLSLTVPLASFAELLWSQLVQLRSALPICSRTGLPETSWELPADVVGSHDVLASFISEKGLHLHHICLDGDWNIVSALNTGSMNGCKDIRAYCLGMVKALMTGSTRTDLVFDFQNRPMRLLGVHGTPSHIRSALPRSLLLAGTTLGTLKLSGCGLESLPDHFGSYFPNLSTLELADNKLEEMPKSIVLLRNLSLLSIGNNQIVSLPTPFALEKLVTFSAPNNLLKEVPASLKYCKDLEVLDLSGNPLRPEFWSLVLQLKKLRQLYPQPPARST